MDLHQIGTLYAHEVRSALREKSIVAMSVIVPVVMYPAMLWALLSGISFVEGQAERMTSRVAVMGVPELHASFLDTLAAAGRVEVIRWEADAAEGHRQVARGRLDALVTVGAPADGGEALPDNFRAVVAYSGARDRSLGARARVEAALAAYRARWIEGARSDLGISGTTWADYGVARSDVATPDDTTRFLLALIVPFLTLVTVALAAFYPAIDATAGERERATWETLMSAAASRESIAVAKYLYVATFGAVGGLLNLGALFLSMRWILSPMAGDGAGALASGGIPLQAVAIILAGTALLGLFVAGGMLLFAVFARNFKEGQSMIAPFSLVVMLPAIFVQSADIEFTPLLAAVPVANVALLIRDALIGSPALVPGLVTLLSMSFCVVAAIGLAQWVLRREDVFLASGDGGLLTFLRRQARGTRSAA